MKIAGVVICVFGALLFLSAINVAITQYDLNSLHDVSKFFGAFGFSVLVLAAGVYLLVRSGAIAKRTFPRGLILAAFIGLLAVVAIVIAVSRSRTRPVQQEGIDQATPAAPGNKATPPEHFDGFSFQVPNGWRRIAADRAKTRAILLLGEVPPNLPAGSMPATTKGMIKVDAGEAALPNPRDIAAAFAKDFGGKVLSEAVDVDGEQGIVVRITSPNPALMPRRAIVVARKGQLYMIMAGAIGSVDVSDAFEEIRKTWKWDK